MPTASIATTLRKTYRSVFERARPPEVQHFPPIATPNERRPIVRDVVDRLLAIVVAPTKMVLDHQKRHGDVFTVRVPFKFDLTYLLTKKGYSTLMGLDPAEGVIGPVFLNVPCVGRGFPRSDKSGEYCQTLILASRAFMAGEILAKPQLDAVPAIIEAAADEHIHRWGRDIDITKEFISFIYDASGRACVGEALWARIGVEAKPLLRDIVDGIDIPRAMVNTTPLHYVSKEYKASQRLHRLLVQVIAEHARTGAYPIIDRVAAIRLGEGQPLPAVDVPWVLMYVLWNALSYPGSYGAWALVDILAHQSVREHAASLPLAERRRFYADCFDETARLSPVASVIRVVQRDLTIEHENKDITIPAGDFVGTFPYVLCRDPEDFRHPELYDPKRYGRGEKRPPLYGKGAFGCPARSYNKVFASHLFEALFSRVSLELTSTPPERRCRVHLTYPSASIFARVGAPAPVRARQALATASA
jgi:hypothetical protein